MKTQTKWIIIAIVAVAIVSAVIVYIMKRKGLFSKKYELTDSAKDFLNKTILTNLYKGLLSFDFFW